jgi:hypothetical protein
MMERDKKFIAVIEETTKMAALIRLMDDDELGTLFMTCLAAQPIYPDQKAPDAQVNKIIVTITGELVYRRKFHGELPRDENAEELVNEIRKQQPPPIM